MVRRTKEIIERELEQERRALKMAVRQLESLDLYIETLQVQLGKEDERVEHLSNSFVRNLFLLTAVTNLLWLSALLFLSYI